MSLTLAVPELSARNAADVELQPQKVKTWLEELPLLNVAETSRKLFTTLSTHNRVGFDSYIRLQLLELFRYPVNQLSLELSRQYIGLPLPLSEKHKTIAEQNRQLQMEMANGYKRIVLDAGADPDVRFKNPAIQALALQRAIRYLTGVLAVSYQTYSSCPQDTWKEIHALYVHAEKTGLGPVEVEDPLNQAVARGSVSHAYKQALLLGFSDPYHLPPRTLDRTHLYLDRWAPLAQLTEVAPTYNPTCQFLIDPDNDRAGIVYTADSQLKNRQNYRLLNTVELARQVHSQLTLLMSGKMPPSEGLPENFFQESGQDLLRRLINAWGVNPQRSFRRNERPGHQVEMAIGLEAINYWINGGKEFVVSSAFVGPTPQRTQIGFDEKKPANRQLPGQELATWDVADEGAGGLSLSRSGQFRMHVHVGDIVITRAPGLGNPWSLGVIRWVRSAGSSNIELGIQRLAPSADPVVVKTVTEENKESDFLPALLLPEIKPLKQPQTLITHHGVFKPELQVYLDNGYRLYKIVPTRLIEESSAYEQFRFDILNA